MFRNLISPLLSPFVLAATLALVAVPAQATLEFISTNRYVLPANTVESRELWVLAQTEEIQGQAQNDLFLIATAGPGHTNGAILLGGVCSNDVWALGSSIRLKGQALDHARLLASEAISIEGAVANGLMAIAPQIFIAPSASIEGSAWLAGSDVMVNGRVHGPTRIYGKNVTLAGSFGDSVTLVAAQNLTLMPGTIIHGDLFYTAPSELFLDPKVHVTGRLVRVAPAPPPSRFTWTFLLLELTTLLGALLTGILFATFFPTFNARALQTLEVSPWKCLGIGLAATFALPAAAVVFLLLGVGLPLALLTAGLWIALLYLAKFIVALALGRRILRTLRPDTNVFWTLLVGLVIVWTLSNLPPPAGWLTWLVVAVFGLGSMTLTLLDHRIPVLVTAPPLPGQNPEKPEHPKSH
jgi:cytoskeletal protein CcmA (bactofilin family)